MAIPIIMPQLGENIETGIIREWMKKENEKVCQGEPIYAVEADKGVLEVEAEKDGILLKILVREGAEARVLSTIGYIGQPGEQI